MERQKDFRTLRKLFATRTQTLKESFRGIESDRSSDEVDCSSISGSSRSKPDLQVRNEDPANDSDIQLSETVQDQILDDHGEYFSLFNAAPCINTLRSKSAKSGKLNDVSAVAQAPPANYQELLAALTPIECMRDDFLSGFNRVSSAKCQHINQGLLHQLIIRVALDLHFYQGFHRAYFKELRATDSSEGSLDYFLNILISLLSELMSAAVAQAAQTNEGPNRMALNRPTQSNEVKDASYSSMMDQTAPLDGRFHAAALRQNLSSTSAYSKAAEPEARSAAATLPCFTLPVECCGKSTENSAPTYSGGMEREKEVSKPSSIVVRTGSQKVAQAGTTCEQESLSTDGASPRHRPRQARQETLSHQRNLSMDAKQPVPHSSERGSGGNGVEARRLPAVWSRRFRSVSSMEVLFQVLFTSCSPDRIIRILLCYDMLEPLAQLY